MSDDIEKKLEQYNPEELVSELGVEKTKGPVHLGTYRDLDRRSPQNGINMGLLENIYTVQEMGGVVYVQWVENKEGSNGHLSFYALNGKE